MKRKDPVKFRRAEPRGEGVAMSGRRETVAKSATTKEMLVILGITFIGSFVLGWMSEDVKGGIGRIAGFIIVMASIPYIIAIFRRGATPNRATWWIWTILSILLASSYYASGAHNTIWVPLVYVIDQGVVAILSLSSKYGERRKNKLDTGCIAGAIMGIFLWWLSGSAAMALAAFITADLMGSVPTIEKAYSRPESEDKFAWAMTLTGNALNIFAAEKLTAEILAYPVYAAVTSGVILLPLLRRKQKG